MVTTWTTNVYTQERSILTLSGFTTGAYSVVIATTSPAGYSARYIIPSSGVLAVDLSDLVRIAASGGFTVTEYNQAGTALSAAVSLSWIQAGRIAPLSVIVPECPLYDSFLVVIMPPPIMLKSISNNVPVQFEMYGKNGYSFATGRVKYLPGGEVENFNNEMEVPSSADVLEFWHLEDANYYSLPLKDLECDKRYAMVEWVSYTGRVRRHTFEVVKVTTETTEDVSIETLTNEYDIRKNRVDSFTLRLDNLDKYALWYYSDLITSSQVKVSLDGTKWYQVEVTAKKQTMPETDAGKFNVLEIPVNFRKYDTL